MKTLLFLACAMVSGWTCVAAPACQPKGDTFPVFTDGIDLYEDGTQVLDGERYALVYVAEGQTFGGFLTDGTLADPANNKIVTDKLYAKGGKCEYTPVQIPEGFRRQAGPSQRFSHHGGCPTVLGYWLFWFSFFFRRCSWSFARQGRFPQRQLGWLPWRS